MCPLRAKSPHPPLQAEGLSAHLPLALDGFHRDLCAVDEFSSCILLLIPHLFIDSRSIYSPTVCQGLVWAFEDTEV